MIITIKKVLKPAVIKQVQLLLEKAHFVDGKLSAGDSASSVKNNLELSLQSPLHQQLNNLVMAELVSHPTYQAAVLPSKVASAFYSCYSEGMSYGAHVDDAVMGPLSGRYRTDVSSTVFLNNPEEYDGGELRIYNASGYDAIKLEAGDAVIYSSGSLHEVTEVKNGKRLVAVSWAQSMVKSSEQRQVLYDFSMLRESLASDNEAERVKLDKIYSNLMRMWAEL
jgi:PKHD-type hydroxylase